MKIQVFFFGALRELVGRAEESVEVEPGCDVGKLLERYSSSFPALEPYRRSLLFSRNREFVDRNQKLEEGDEVAFLPPVSGGAPEAARVPGIERNRIICRLTREPIQTVSMVAELQRGEDGAVVTFEGVVRNHSGGRSTLFLEYEAYEPMALEQMRRIAEELLAQFPIDRMGMMHRLGRLEIGEPSVVIVVTAAHRKAAFAACQEAIHRLKQTVPIWKKEFFADGAVWVEGEGAPVGVAGQPPSAKQPEREEPK